VCSSDLNARGLDQNERPKLMRLVDDAETKVTRIAYLGRRIEFMAQCLQAVQRTRYREEGKQ
jgi:hypothetical protein